MLELRALGNAEIRTDRTTLTPSQEIVFASALYLLLESKKKVSRTALAELLWPEVDVSTRAHRLRQTLFQLKKLGFPVSADKNHVFIAADRVLVDIERVPLDEKEVEGDASLEFLPGYSPRFSEPFRDWVDTKRSEVHARCSRSLINCLRHERGRANWSGVESTARMVLRLDPFNETAVLALAEATALRGQKRAALAMLDEYLQEIGSNNDIRLPATVLRKRLLDAPLSPPSLASGHPEFVGREKEMAILSRALSEAKKGRGGACLIVGEPGIGKSRLAAELAKFAQLQGFQTQAVSCQRSNVDRPMSVLVDLVPALRDMPGAIGCSQDTLIALRRLTEFDSRAPEMSAFTAEPYALQHAVRVALFDLLDAITEEVPLLLVLDDIQWIDKTSADLIAAMIAAAKKKPLLFVLTSRTNGDKLTEVFADTAASLTLEALSEVASESLLRALVSDHLSHPLHDNSGWILSVSEGNPFFLQELAKHWYESGQRGAAPASVSMVLHERLSRLSIASLRVLQACTILGHNSTVERIEQVLEYPSHELVGAIQELTNTGMLTGITEASDEPVQALRPRHDLLATAVMKSISAPSRAFLHRRAGMVLEKELIGDRMPTRVLWACAFHWHHAGERGRALSMARSYAEHLLEMGLPNDASDAISRALEYCTSYEQRISLLARHAAILQMSGEWERSKEVLRTCSCLRRQISSDATRHDGFELLLFEAARRTTPDEAALLSDVLECFSSGDASADHRIRAGIIALKIASDVDPSVMDSVYSGLTSLFASWKCDDELSRIEAEMVYHSHRGSKETALDAARNFVRLARQSGDPGRLVGALISAANSSRINGIEGEAEGWLYETIECALRHHLPEKARIAMQCLARLALSQSDLTLAQQMLAKSKTLPPGRDNLRSTIEMHSLEARIALQEDRVADAVRALQNAQASVPNSLSPSAQLLALAIQVRIRNEEGAEALRPLVSELEKKHLKLRTLGLHDFETESLFAGLSAIGEDVRGLQLVHEYVSDCRREQRALSPGLVLVLQHLPGSETK